MVNVAVLVSGGGTNLAAIIKAKKEGLLPSARLRLVLSDRCDAYALRRAEEQAIPTLCIDKKTLGRKEFEHQLVSALEEKDIGLIVLAGFLSILSPAFTKRFANRIINVHPSLIPSFCGKGFYGLKVHESALSYGVKVTGATVHLVNEVPDGGKILLQKAVEVKDGDSPELLQKRVMEEAEWIILPQGVELMCKTMEKEAKNMELSTYLDSNSYPGRFLLGGNGTNGEAVLAYAIMGRSENSRNRIFEKTDIGLRTRAYDEELVADPSLIIYNAMRESDDAIILTNGDQTDTIFNYLLNGKSLEEALITRTYEPDAPSFTPRISQVMAKDGSAYSLSILKKKEDTCERTIYTFTSLPGYAHIIHTYRGDGNPLPSFAGNPPLFRIPENGQQLADLLWNHLNHDNRISLYVRYGKEEIIINGREDA